MRSAFVSLVAIIATLLLSSLPAYAITISGSASFGAFYPSQGPATAFTNGDVIFYEFELSDDSSATFNNQLIAMYLDPVILAMHLTVYRAGSQIYDLQLTNPTSGAFASVGNGNLGNFQTNVSGTFATINGHDIEFAGVAFSDVNIFAITPVAGEAYTLGELFGDGTGLAASNLDVVMAAENSAGNGLDTWHFLGNSSVVVVPEPGGMLLLTITGIFGLLTRRRR